MTTTDTYTPVKIGSRNWQIHDACGNVLTDSDCEPLRFKSKAEAEAEIAASQADEANGVPQTDAEAVAARNEAIAAMSRTDRVAAAMPEARALSEWRAGGEQGPRPATPHLDFMNDPNAKPKPAARKQAETVPVRTPEEEAAMIDIITTRREAGDSWGKVAQALNDAGVRTTRGGPWWDTTVSDLAKRLGLVPAA